MKQVASGLAWEYALVKELHDQLSKLDDVGCSIVESNKYINSKGYFDELDPDNKSKLIKDARILISEVIRLENDHKKFSGEFNIEMLTDSEGVKGDVRDIVICREVGDGGNNREFGISAKNNSSSSKSPRISKKSPDIFDKWTGGKYRSSKFFKSGTENLFKKLEPYKRKKDKDGKIINGCNWNELPADINLKEKIYPKMVELVYKEIDKFKDNRHAINQLFCFLIGNKDYYKLFRANDKPLQIQSFNYHGSLGVGCIDMPKKIVKNKIDCNRDAVIDIEFDNGFEFSLRVHNGSSGVETSLKIEVEGIKHPDTLYSKIIEDKECNK